MNSELVICDNETKVKMLLDIASRVPSLKTIVAMDTISDEMKTKAAEASIKVVYFDDLEVYTQTRVPEHGRTQTFTCEQIYCNIHMYTFYTDILYLLK